MATTTTVGILGGGQLARMMVMAGKRMGLGLKVLDPRPGPCVDVGAQAALGDFKSPDDVVASGSRCDVVTCDLEGVSVKGLEALVAKGIPVHPSPSILATIQDKYCQKTWLREHGFDQTPFGLLETPHDGKRLSFPLVAKKRVGAYDGRGVWFVDNREDLAALPFLCGLYWEAPVDIGLEVAISVCVFPDEIVLYPLVHTVQKDGICVEVRCPAAVPKDVHDACLSIATAFGNLMQGEGSLGIYALELFVTKTLKVLVNEVSPRPHNSAHYTLEACVTDQFENHLRAICGLRPGSAAVKAARTRMVNLLGACNPLAAFAEHGNDDKAKVHWYGKDPPKPGRKMGHLTTTAIAHHTSPLVAIIMGSSSDMPTMEAAWVCLEEAKLPYTCQIVSAHRDPEAMVAFAKNAETMGYKVIIAAAGGAAHLPGMVASLTPLPVIGVPVPTKDLGGQDSLYSIVQMPDGVPVATVGIGKARNAAILALRILGTSIPEALDASRAVLDANKAKVATQRRLNKEV